MAIFSGFMFENILKKKMEKKRTKTKIVMAAEDAGNVVHFVKAKGCKFHLIKGAIPWKGGVKWGVNGC